MTKNLASFRMFLANCTGNAQNSIYRTSATITSADDLATACRKDHVCVAFTECHRKNENYIRGYAFAADCDNDFTDDPAAWITPAAIAEQLHGVAFYAVKSRNCNKVKHPGEPGEKSARPRYHYYFPLRVPIEGYQDARSLTDMFLSLFPMFDDEGTKPAQFFYGHAEPVAEYYPGEMDIREYFRENPIEMEPEPDADPEPAENRKMGAISDDFAALNVDDMLSHISANCDYGTWYQVGMAIKAAGLPFEIWDGWSKTAPDLYPGIEKMRRKWLSFKDGRITFGTLVHMAKGNGWTADPAKLTGEAKTNFEAAENVRRFRQEHREEHRAALAAIGIETDNPYLYTWTVNPDGSINEVTDKGTGKAIYKRPASEVVQGKTVYQADPAAAAPAEKTEDNVPDFEEYDSDYFNNTEITPPEPLITEILYPGLGMLGAPAKMGKSYLLLQMAFCVAEGKAFLGFEVKRPGAVLYLDLQGSKARTKQRMQAMGYNRMPKGITIVYKSRKTDNGLFTQIDRWLHKTQNPVLIIVDMMEQVKGSQRKAEDAYRADSRILEPLHELSLKHDISIMVSMHTRKGNKILPDDDAFNEIIGSVAQFGTADCAWMIIGKRTNDTKRFSTICRDNVEGQQDYEIIFNNHRWSMAGTVEDCAEERARKEYNRNPVVFTIRKLVEESGGGWYGTMSDLITEVMKRAEEYPADTPEKMHHLVDRISYRLYAEDGISIEPQSINGGPKGRRYKFFRERPKQIEF